MFQHESLKILVPSTNERITCYFIKYDNQESCILLKTKECVTPKERMSVTPKERMSVTPNEKKRYSKHDSESSPDLMLHIPLPFQFCSTILGHECLQVSG